MLSPAPSVELEAPMSDTDISVESGGSATKVHESKQVFDEMENRRHGSDGRLLWEFIYQLLQCPSVYKDYIIWETKQELVFRIVNPTGLAELWGNQKNRTNMTYEKLSRALRYYYRMNIIKKVHGKRLTYRFLQQPEFIQKGQRGARPHSRNVPLDACPRSLNNVERIPQICNTHHTPNDDESPTVKTEAMAESTNQQLRHFLCSKKQCKFPEDTENSATVRTETDGSLDSSRGSNTMENNCDILGSTNGVPTTPPPFSSYAEPVVLSSETNGLKVEVQSEPEDLSMSTLRKLETGSDSGTRLSISPCNVSCLDEKSSFNRTVEDISNNS